MVEATNSTSEQDEAGVPSFGAATYTYDQWMQSVGIPVHKGYFIPNLNNLELAWWEDRGCQAAFIQLMGQEELSKQGLARFHRASRCHHSNWRWTRSSMSSVGGA